MASTDTRPRLIVIGSGWVGLYIAQYINTTQYAVTIISPRRTSAYTPLLASAACGLFPFSCAEESLRSKRRDVKFYKAKALGADFEKRVVRCEPAFDDDESLRERTFDVGYDKLVIAPGCETNTFGTPGVQEHALFMKNVSDAMVLRKMLFDQLEKASLPNVTEEQAKGMLHVAIVGGGPTGVELTAELSDLSQTALKDLYPDVAPLIRITVYDMAPHILGAYDQKLYEYATEKMVKNGVQIATSSVIEKVDDEHLYVKGKEPIPYGLLLWVTGNKSLPLVDALDVKKSEHGLARILTDWNLRVKRAGDEVLDDVFALGDAADIEGQSLPTTAEVAVQKARYIVRLLEAPTHLEPFKYKNRGLVSYIGSHDGIGAGASDNNGWTGQRAWLSWRSGSFTWTRTWRNWIGIIFAMIVNVLFGKDVARM